MFVDEFINQIKDEKKEANTKLQINNVKNMLKKNS